MAFETGGHVERDPGDHTSKTPTNPGEIDYTLWALDGYLDEMVADARDDWVNHPQGLDHMDAFAIEWSEQMHQLEALEEAYRQQTMSPQQARRYLRLKARIADEALPVIERYPRDLNRPTVPLEG